ncbi:acyl-CoA dehydrogenase family protein [Actinomarinicola tropica]|uniref:Acyl-CoA dehydrogenase n=1 Tax=Actinomarinicola tropica TaxID=2789776 RepID=A0A5Q2RN62_9ACTN|nr:acyl-CoA dehydrogenase family protein [Actinomarinicola tropica]QGG95340.1 acyl-CoA dehydrogenase [Actinomarinicola tropica]
MTATDTTVDTDEARVRDLVGRLVAEHDPSDVTGFLGAQFDLGLAWVHFPEGHGGLGLSPKLQNVVNTELAKVHAPSPYGRNPIGYGMGAPTVVTHGSEEQKQRYLRPLFTGEEIWCQLFSEPGAGSDVAGLSTRAIRDGDEWIVNGQKVWTTLAHLSRWGMLVARTDPDQPKHKGLTYFVVDMEAPGVDVRPLRQMTGDAEFNEVYFTDVRIPDAERLGDIGEGWKVSLTTLMNERVSIGGTVAPRGSGYIATAVREFTERAPGMTPAERAAKKDQLMALWVRAEVLRLTNIRAAENRKAGVPGPEGSVGKLASAELNKEITAFTMNAMGSDAFLYDDYAMRRPETAADASTPQRGFLRMRANSIEGGTTEIMKNILGERVLGLPGDVRVDKDRPWVEVPRS